MVKELLYECKNIYRYEKNKWTMPTKKVLKDIMKKEIKNQTTKLNQEERDYDNG